MLSYSYRQMNQKTKQLHYPLKIYCTLLGYSMNHLHQEVYKSANVYECLMCECCNIDSKMFSLECFYLLQSNICYIVISVQSYLLIMNVPRKKISMQMQWVYYRILCMIPMLACTGCPLSPSHHKPYMQTLESDYVDAIN